MAAALQLLSHRMTPSHPMTKTRILPETQPMPAASDVYRKNIPQTTFDPWGRTLVGKCMFL